MIAALVKIYGSLHTFLHIAELEKAACPTQEVGDQGPDRRDQRVLGRHEDGGEDEVDQHDLLELSAGQEAPDGEEGGGF